MTSLNTATSRSSGRQSLNPPFLACEKSVVPRWFTDLCDWRADCGDDHHVIARVDKDPGAAERGDGVGDRLKSGRHCGQKD